MTAIKYLTIHCAATPEGRDVKAKDLEAWGIARFGQKSYHWIVELSGVAVLGLADHRRGAHTARANTGNIGICYVGGMDSAMRKAKDTRTPAQRDRLAQLVAMYQDNYPGIIVRGHRDWPGVKKDCPSFDVDSWLRDVGLA